MGEGGDSRRVRAVKVCGELCMENNKNKHTVRVTGFDNEVSDGLLDTSFNTMKQMEARLKWMKRKLGWVKKERALENFSSEKK